MPTAVQAAYSPLVSPLVRTEDLVDARGVAEVLGLAHVASVSTYLNRYRDMPRPIVNLGRGRARLWLRPAIEKWAKETGRL